MDATAGKGPRSAPRPGFSWGSVADANRTSIERDPPEVVYDTGYETSPARPNYALTSTVLGGVLGGIIGNNSGGRHGWEGAAIGAGLGYLIGSAAERPPARRVYAVSRPAPTFRPAQVTASEVPPAPVARPMDGANAMFGRQ